MHYENRFLGTFRGHSKRPNIGKMRNMHARYRTSVSLYFHRVNSHVAENGLKYNISNPTMRTGLDFTSVQFDQVGGA